MVRCSYLANRQQYTALGDRISYANYELGAITISYLYKRLTQLLR